MQQRYLTQTASIVGVILIVLGIVLLTYFAAPLRLLVQDLGHQNSNLAIPIIAKAPLG